MPSKCKVTVTGGEHDRSFCPVTAYIPWGYADCFFASMIDAKSGRQVPCQVEKSGKGIELSWLINGLKAGESQEFIVAPLERDCPKPTVHLEDVVPEGKVDVRINGQLFTSYHYGLQWVRPFLHPVVGPMGTQVTRNYPIRRDVKGETQDHPHHKSIWVAYGECGAAKVDNWSEDPDHGYQRHMGFRRLVSGPVFGRIVAKNDWCANKEKKQFEEIRDMRFYSLPGGERLFDVSVTFRMTEGPVTFHDTKEGGLISVRVATSMDVTQTGRIENAYGGINESETWGKSAPWCDYSGIVDGVYVGMAVMDHESNPRYPTGWHVRDYGLMTANCFAWRHYRPEARIRGDMRFEKGSKTTWKYRLYIHKGDAKKGKVGARFMDFIAPPTVTLG